jgi:hypothetical protein
MTSTNSATFENVGDEYKGYVGSSSSRGQAVVAVTNSIRSLSESSHKPLPTIL